MPERITNVTTDNAILGAVISLLREQHAPPMQQQELAAKMGLSASAWSRVEKGDTELSAAQIWMLSKLFIISSDRIFEMADQIKEDLKRKGVAVQPQSAWKELSKSKSITASGTAIAGLAASGLIPVFGPVLFGIVSGIMASRKIRKNDEK